MKTKTITALVIVSGFFTAGAFADNPPVTPAPAPADITAPAPAPDQIIYTPQLPGVKELISVAAAQGLTVKQITQSAQELSATYQAADGKTRTVSYQLLSGAASNRAPAAAPTAVYAMPPPLVYYYDPYYAPAYWYPPVFFRFGYGFGRGHRW